MNKYLKKYSYFFLLFPFICYAAVFAVPFFYGLVVSFTDPSEEADFTGAGNYLAALLDGDFLNSLRFSFLYSVTSAVIINLIAFFLAALFCHNARQTKPRDGVNNCIILLPGVICGIAAAYIWKIIIRGNSGIADLINISTVSGFWGMVIVSCWQWTGLITMIYLAGIKSIPGEMLEAAKLDGAGRRTLWAKIKLPFLAPWITSALIITLIILWTTFDQNLAYTEGHPDRKTTMAALDIYNDFSEKKGFEGVIQAKGVIFFAVTAILAFAQFGLLKKQNRREQDSR